MEDMTKGMGKSVLVTGGAGYIGSVCVKRLVDRGYRVVVVDNLSKGLKKLIDSRAEFYEGDLANKRFIEYVFMNNSFDYVVHFAAYKAVGESMTEGVKYSDNLTGAINLLNCMAKAKVKKIIFSSSAGIYGDVNGVIDEETIADPINFYGFTKLEMERILKWYHKIYGISYVSLRYFNVAGDELNYVDPDAQNIFPIIMEVIKGKRDRLTIFGDDYDTPDGTCVRDYIDVRDLVDAHILAINAKYDGPINLGSGKGYSVKELVDAFKKISGVNFRVEIGGRRVGDPAILIASNERAHGVLGWIPKHTLDEMISSTVKAYEVSS